MEKEETSLQSGQHVLEQLNSSPEGLSQAEAEKRRAVSGSNVLTRGRHTAWGILGRQLNSSLVYLLAFACVFSFILRDLSDGIIIAVILVINTAFGFFQEYHSEQAVEKLSTFISKRVPVKRDGKTILLDESRLVPGDILSLEEGDIVPADCKLLTTENLQVNESQLTGEAVPVSKEAGAGTGRPVPGDGSLLFTGSVIEKGEATGVVYAIGDGTELGKIATLSTGTHKVTQYEKSLESFSSFLLKTVLVILGVTFVIKLLLVHNLSLLPHLLLFIIALAIAVVPEALPVIATLTLSTGAVQLAKQHVVAKRLSSIEDLGNLNILCTDKTGTLTEGRMTVQKVMTDDPLQFQLLACASVEPLKEGEKVSGNYLDAAFLAYIPAEIQEQARRFKQTEALPFDPDARRKRVVIEDTPSGTCTLVVLGAVETLLGLSDGDGKRAAYLAEAASAGRQGLRAIGLAYRPLPSTDHINIPDFEQGLTFLGLVTLVDPLRPTTKQTLAQAAGLGVTVKILSGDSKEVAAYVGSQLGLGELVYTGEEMAHFSPEQFKNAAEKCNVFARLNPSQKYAIIKALKDGNIVGYQGDGINDAPSLKLADVGLAVDSATDVAKESADIVLLNRDLGVIINGIRQGRAIFHDIDKYLKYTMVGNFGNLFAMAVLYLVSLDLPLLPVQLLLTSLITDVPLLTIASDTVDNKETRRPEKYNARSLVLISVVLGTCTALFELLFFAFVTTRAPLYIQTSMFIFLTLLQLVVIVSIRHRTLFWKGSGPSPILGIAMALAFIVSVALPYIPFTARLFNFYPLPLLELGLALGLSVAYVVILDLVKVWYYRSVEKESPSSASSST